MGPLTVVYNNFCSNTLAINSSAGYDKTGTTIERIVFHKREDQPPGRYGIQRNYSIEHLETVVRASGLISFGFSIIPLINVTSESALGKPAKDLRFNKRKCQPIRDCWLARQPRDITESFTVCILVENEVRLRTHVLSANDRAKK